ncbi:hypothetical protein LO763_26430 [Glycomyces sp. A-F 0318]|uniref:hypothetical protein n=1 Tax=Glycomyces amatae TaxID=2881355 RepID=UPI001E3329E5|nr:hypothetical protein [Glycomyces amatae]MCD0447159.1 hypothetical protein [Glycomyces amatae]
MSGSLREPPVRSGELLRHLADPRDAKAMLTVVKVVLIAGAAWAVMVGFMAAFPVDLIIIVALAGVMVGVWFFMYRPLREQHAGDPDPDALIELLVVPEGLVTHGGLDVRWREIEAVHVEEREHKGKGIHVHVIVTLNTGGVRERATGEQRMAFVPFGGRIDVRLGMISKASRKTTSTVLREQCERVSVPFSSERRVVAPGGG